MQKQHIFEYEGKNITVRYDVKRCIHAKECVHGLPEVFDPQKRPWIEPDQAEADQLADVVLRCPTGALHYSRKDEGPAESWPATNRAELAEDGPLYISGTLQLFTAESELLMQESRVALCRCGKSANKPFCDNAHQKAEFKDDGLLGEAAESDIKQTGKLELTLLTNGPILARGGMVLHSADGTQLTRHEKAAFCRCGASKNKPYCDGSHVAIQFEAD